MHEIFVCEFIDFGYHLCYVSLCIDVHNVIYELLTDLLSGIIVTAAMLLPLVRNNYVI